MFTIYFSGNCFEEFESTLYLINCPKKEIPSLEKFVDKALDYLLEEKVIYENYKEKKYIKSTKEDIEFIENILDNMKKSVRFEFNNILNYYTMSDENLYEHLVILEQTNNYIMLYWNTTA